MRDELLLYYERELSFLRQSGAEFANKYPKVASRLALEPDKCEDPHVERLLEGFALLAGRIHLKIDDDFPEITEALLDSVYPHFLRPIPSMSIVEFEVDPNQIKPDAGVRLARGATLLSRPVEGTRCRFETCYDMTFWPIAVTGGSWRGSERSGAGARNVQTAGAFSIQLQTQTGIPLSKLNVDTLPFFINAESELAYTIYELISNNCGRITIRDAGAQAGAPIAVLPASSLRPMGFGEDEAALPYAKRSFAGYRTIQEYLAFPQKFLFVELKGLAAALSAIASDRIEIEIAITPFANAERRLLLESGVSERTFRLWCVPVINVFGQTAEPILLDHRKFEYQVVPDASARQALEIFSIEDVLSVDPATRETVRYEPFHALRHAGTSGKAYWRAARRTSERSAGRAGEMFLSIVDPTGSTFAAEAQVLTVRTRCTNGDLPVRLPIGMSSGDFELEGTVAVRRITALVKPTESLRPPTASESLWRLLSHLSLNYLSLVENGADALREMLHLYDFGGAAHTSRQIDGIVSVRSQRHFAPLLEQGRLSFARGTQVEMELDEEQFVGGGIFLFAAVIESFLSQYVSMNSFCKLLARTRQRKEPLKLWPARAGRKVLL